MKLQPRFVSITMLKRSGACTKSVKRFRRAFGERATLTRENLRHAQNANMNLWWLAFRYIYRLKKEARITPKQHAQMIAKIWRARSWEVANLIWSIHTKYDRL